jgi:hypothetical protein
MPRLARDRPRSGRTPTVTPEVQSRILHVKLHSRPGAAHALEPRASLDGGQSWKAQTRGSGAELWSVTFGSDGRRALALHTARHP